MPTSLAAAPPRDQPADIVADVPGRSTPEAPLDSLAAVPFSPLPAANVASVPQRSPLRYPGGKTWLIPHAIKWLRRPRKPSVLFEPFAGGAIISLTAVMEGLVDRCVLVDRDRDVAAFWHAALTDTDALCALLSEFQLTRKSVNALVSRPPRTLTEHAFRTLVLNRTRHGGKLAPGANLLRTGENEKGITSRWYPDTLAARLRHIKSFASKITFCESDGLQLLESFALIQDAVLFIDPPYTVGGKGAGERLYKHNSIDHIKLFQLLADSKTDFLMTYDPTPEILQLVRQHDFAAVQVTMTNVHHARLPELIVTRRAIFQDSPPDSSRPDVDMP